MIKILDGVLYGTGGALGMLIGFTLANDISPWLRHVTSLIF